MKTREVRMQKVFLLAEAEENKQCRAMGQSQQSLNDEMQRLEELKSYRLSYGAESAQRQFNSLQWKEYQNFLKRLDKAVEVQTQVVADSRLKRDAHRLRWVTKRRHAESLERVVQRFANQAMEEEERSLQKATDELAVNSNTNHKIFRS
ncbi:MAG: flagellar export protein FliJ [Woeseia sp.]